MLGKLEEKEKKEERNGGNRVGVLGRERAGENEEELNEWKEKNNKNKKLGGRGRSWE